MLAVFIEGRRSLVEQFLETEVDRNFDAFSSMLPDLLQQAPGKYALLHAGELVGLFDTSLTAFIEGARRFGEGRFSVQEVTQQSDNLGFYSYAGGAGQA
jgi:hypothetical protein